MEESKYLEPKFSNSFKDLLGVTATVDTEYVELQKKFELESQKEKESGGLPKDSLSFSRDKTTEELKGWGAGKIRQQLLPPR